MYLIVNYAMHKRTVQKNDFFVKIINACLHGNFNIEIQESSVRARTLNTVRWHVKFQVSSF